MKKVRITEATASLAEYTRKLKQGPVIVTVDGEPVAALVAIEGVDWETLSVGTNPRFLDLIERSRRRQEAEGGISAEEMSRRLRAKSAAKRKSKPNSHKPKANRRAKKNGSRV